MFSEVFAALHHLRLDDALRLLTDHQAAGGAVDTQEIANIRDDLNRMLDYMQSGYDDPQRANIYVRLLERLYVVAANALMVSLCRDRSLFRQEQALASQQTFDADTVRATLQDFLIAANLPDGDHTALHARHHHFMKALFAHILVGRQWTAAQQSFYADLLTSPLCDEADSALLVSAVTMACLVQFDAAKFLTLIRVHEQAASPATAARALVGWCLALPLLPRHVYPEVACKAAEQTEKHLNDVLDLQRQVICCLRADRDDETIRRDIMPGIIRNSNLRFTPDGIREADDDPMEDILHPDAEDKRMEQTEQLVRRMVDMQQRGADIYFGGFKQTKRFPFFYTLSNWFTPFRHTHPDIRDAEAKMAASPMLGRTIDSGPFCDSDRYSLALAFASIVDQLPPQLREMMQQTDATDPMATPIDTTAPAFRRLAYLQDLYRFFRLSPWRNELPHNPFADTPEAPHFFLASPCLDGIHSLSLALMRARFHRSQGRNEEALADLQPYEASDAHHHALLTIRASALTALGRHGEAADAYAALLTSHPDDHRLQLRHALALTRAGRCNEALPLLFRLHYATPDDLNVCRTLAWALLSEGRDEQASPLYEKILASADATPDDHLNAGYCDWFARRIDRAACHFHIFLTTNERHATLANEFGNDDALLTRHHISTYDRLLMEALARRTSTDQPAATAP